MPNSHPDNTQELEQIVEDAYAGEISWIHDQLDGTSFAKDEFERVHKDKLEAIARIQALITRKQDEARNEQELRVYTDSTGHHLAFRINRNGRDNFVEIGITYDQYERFIDFAKATRDITESNKVRSAEGSLSDNSTLRSNQKEGE